MVRSLESRIYGNFKSPGKLKEIEKKLEEDKLAIKNYLSASEVLVGPSKWPLHEVIWEIVELRGNGLEPLHGYKEGKNVSEEQFKSSIEALDSLAHALSDLSSPSESKWTKYSADRIRPNLIPQVKSILTQMKEIAERAQETLDQLNDKFGGERGAWFRFISQQTLDEFNQLTSSIPSAEFECERLLEAGFKGKLQTAYKLLKSQAQADEALAGIAGIDATKFGVAEKIEEDLKFFLPHHAGQSLVELEKIQAKIPSTMHVVDDLERGHLELVELLGLQETPNWINSVDQGFLDLLRNLTHESPATNVDYDRFRDPVILTLGEELCQSLAKLTDVEASLSKLNSTASDAEELTQFSDEVLQPLATAFGDQSVRSLQRAGGWLEDVMTSLETNAQTAMRLQSLGYSGVQT